VIFASFFDNFNSFLPIDAKSCWESFLMPMGYFFLNEKNPPPPPPPNPKNPKK